MSFPTMNAKSVARVIIGSTAASPTGILELLPTGQYNIFSAPGVIDASGMEFSVGVRHDNSSGTAGLAASTADASVVNIAFRDGGASGDNATADNLFAPTTLTNSTAFVANVPKDKTGTTATDLDADDWVNYAQAANPTTVAGGAVYDVVVNYIYGKPGGIN